MKIDFLVGDNEYGSTLYFAKKFCKALERAGVATRLFRINDGLFYKAFHAICNDPPDLTCSFSDITFGDKQPLGDQWQIPHLSLLIDPAMYFLHQLKGAFSLISCVDQEDVDFIKSFGFSKVFFLPHGVDRDLRSHEKERVYEVVMIGSCTDYEEVSSRWKELFSHRQRQILEEAAERVLSGQGISSLRALLEANVQEELPVLHHELDLYIGGRDRVELVRSLEGLPVHIWGRGPWKKYCPNAIIHKPIPYTKTLNIMKKAKIVLNSSPRFKNGSHERIFHGFACGALVATSRTTYIESFFQNGRNIVTYIPEYLGELREKIHSLLNSSQQRQLLIDEGRQITLAHHTWDCRANELLKQLALQGL